MSTLQEKYLFRLMKKEEQPSKGVMDLVSRFHAFPIPDASKGKKEADNCSMLDGSKVKEEVDSFSILEGLKVKAKVDGTSMSPKEEKKKEDQPFPELAKINDLCRSAVGSKNIKTLEDILTVYQHKVTSSAKDCYHKPFRARKLTMCMNRTLVYIHLLYQDIKGSVDNTMYLEKMTLLVTMYLDLEIASSRRRKETTKKVISRLASALNMFLDRSEDHILDALMRAKSIKIAEKEVWCPILKKILMSFQKRQMQDTLYVRYLLVFKLWKKIVSDTAERKKINVLAIEKLPAPANFADRYKRFNNVLPRVPTNKNITTFYMQAKIDVTKACQNFMKISKDPTVPVIPNKPLFFEGRSQSTFSGEGNFFDGGASRCLLNEIWSNNDEITSNKRSSTIKKKVKSKKKEKSDSISETDSTQEVLAVKTQPWETAVNVRADVVMINESQPPPPGTEPPPPARIPPPPPPPPPQSKLQPQPLLSRASTPGPVTKVVAKPIATIVAMKKEVVPEEDLPSCIKAMSLVPKIDIKAEQDVEMTPSPVESTKPLYEESQKPSSEEPMETEKPVDQFERVSEMEQVFEECEVQLGDQDLPYIEEEVVEPCNPVGYGESPEADFEKSLAGDMFGASQAKGMVEAEMQEMGRNRPETMVLPAVEAPGVNMLADIHIVPLQHIKSERVDSPEFEPVPCFQIGKVEKVKPERTSSSKPCGLVLASRPKESKSSRHFVPKEDQATVIQAGKLVVSQESHSGLHISDCVPRKSRTLSNEAQVSPSKSHFSSSQGHTLSNKVHHSSNEDRLVSHKIRRSSSEKLSSSSKVRSSSSESRTSSSKGRTPSNEAHISSSKIQTLSCEGHSSTSKVRTSSSEGHKVRTSSCEGLASTPKTHTSTSGGHNSPSKTRPPSSEGILASTKSKASLRESHTSSPKRQNSTKEDRVMPKIPTAFCEGQVRTSLCDSPSPRIQSSTPERNTSLSTSAEGNNTPLKTQTSSRDGHKIRTSSGERQTPSPKIRPSSSGVKTPSPMHEKPRPLTTNTLPHCDKMPTLQAELPSPTKSERRAKPERPQQANGSKLHPENGYYRNGSNVGEYESKQHPDNGFYRNGSYVGEYGQPALPQNLNDLVDLEIPQIQMTDHVWPETVELRVEKAVARKQEMPPPKPHSPRAEKSRSPRSSSPRTPSPRAEFCVGIQRTEQPPPPRVEFSPVTPRVELSPVPPRVELSPVPPRVEPTLVPFSDFAAPKPPSPQKSTLFGFSMAPLPVGIQDMQFAVPRVPEPEPKPRYSLDLGSHSDSYMNHLPHLDLNNPVNDLDYDTETARYCNDSALGLDPYNDIFNMAEYIHTCVNPKVLEQRDTTTSDEELFEFSPFTSDPLAQFLAPDNLNFVPSLSSWQTKVPDTMPSHLLMAGSDDDDSSGYASYSGSTSGAFMDRFSGSEHLNPGPMPGTTSSLVADGTAKTLDVQKPEDEVKAETSKVDSTKRLHVATRSHLQENSVVLNSSPVDGSKPTVPRAGVQSKAPRLVVAKEEAESDKRGIKDVFLGTRVDDDLDDPVVLSRADSGFVREVLSKARVDNTNKRPNTRSLSKVTSQLPDISMQSAPKRQRKLR